MDYKSESEYQIWCLEYKCRSLKRSLKDSPKLFSLVHETEDRLFKMFKDKNIRDAILAEYIYPFLWKFRPITESKHAFKWRYELS